MLISLLGKEPRACEQTNLFPFRSWQSRFFIIRFDGKNRQVSILRSRTFRTILTTTVEIQCAYIEHHDPARGLVTPSLPGDPHFISAVNTS